MDRSSVGLVVGGFGRRLIARRPVVRDGGPRTALSAIWVDLRRILKKFRMRA